MRLYIRDRQLTYKQGIIMEQWLTEGVISGVLANSLTTIVTHMGDKSEKFVRQL